MIETKLCSEVSFFFVQPEEGHGRVVFECKIHTIFVLGSNV